MKTYNFQDFMRGQHEFKRPKSQKVYSFGLGLSGSSMLKDMFLNVPVLVLSGIGLVAIGMTAWENHLAKHGDEESAQELAQAVGIIIAVIGGVASIWLLSHSVNKLF